MRWNPLAVAAAVLLGAGGMLADAADPLPPEVETGEAEALGLEAFTANGRIQPRGRPTRYHFEYGTTTELGSKTEERPLPARLAAHYRETWDANLGGWHGGMSGTDLTLQNEAQEKSTDAAKPPKESLKNGFARFAEPSGNDPNHVDGIGTLHLCKYYYPGLLGRSLWGGGDPDLRDARVQLKVRGNGWVPNGSELVWWTQSDSLIAEQMTANWRRANWAYTGKSLTPLLASGKWETADYRLKNDSHDWTYAGNNLAQKRPNYAYWSIDDAQAHLNADFFHLLTYIDPANPPRGSIDFDDFEVTYRNHSLLLPSNGGELVSQPEAAIHDAALLTDGWRNGTGKQWTSAKPAGPLEITWKFANPVVINTIQIHQHTEWPSRDLELQVSDDGKTWVSSWTAPLAATSPEGPNYAFVVKRDLAAAARWARLRVLSGYKPDHWGLGEVELFGTGAQEGTDDDHYSVNRDVLTLKAGQTYHYRLVATNSAGTVKGALKTFTVPANAKPLAITLPATRVQATSAQLEGRINALGLRTDLTFEYGLTPELGTSTKKEYGGLQISPRAAFAALSNLEPGKTYYYRLTAENSEGKVLGEVREFKTAVKP